MKLRDLQYFIALAETGHFGRAAERSLVSQPTLSAQIHKLENELGVALFERTTKSVVLTPQGRELLAHARRAVGEVDSLKQLALTFRDPLAGKLRVGAIPTVCPYIIPLILRPLRNRNPELKLVVSEEITPLLLERLRNHDIDVALVGTPVTDTDLVAQALYEEPFWLALPDNHPLATRKRITQRDLKSVEMLLLADGHCLTQQTIEVCRLAERTEGDSLPDFGAASLETLLKLVGTGAGAAMVPAMATNTSWLRGEGVVTRPLELRAARRTVSLVWRKSFPRLGAIEAFIEAINAVLPDKVNTLVQT